MAKKLFISHASADSQLIGQFIDYLLVLGAGIKADDIAYTSREGQGVMPGESIPLFIKENIGSADIVLAFISDNYKHSEVCLNEMGAAWALDKSMIQILLPNTSFDKLGWLCSLEKALKITNPEDLDSLYSTIIELLGVPPKIAQWNINKDLFLTKLNCSNTSIMPLPVSCVAHELELGYLDYQGICESAGAQFNARIFLISSSLTSLSEVMNSQARVLNRVTSSDPNRVSKIRQSCGVITSKMNKVSQTIENQLLGADQDFEMMIDACIHMKSIQDQMCDNSTDAADLDAIKALFGTMRECRSVLSGLDHNIDSIPKMEANLNAANKRFKNNIIEFDKLIQQCTAKAKVLAVEFI